MSVLTERIRERAYWMIDIAPATFDADRVADVLKLEEIARQCAVRARGWQYPFIDEHDPPKRFERRIVSETDWEHHLERWEFHRSGLFVIMHGHPPDWRDTSAFWPLRDNETSPQMYLGVTWTLGLLTDFYSFASRLANSTAGDDVVTISTRLENIAGRILYGDSGDRAPFMAAYRYNGASLVDRRSIQRDELAGRSDEIAVEIAAEFFVNFGWRADPRILKDMQQELSR